MVAIYKKKKSNELLGPDKMKVRGGKMTVATETNKDHYSCDRITFPFDSGTATHVGDLYDARTSLAGCDGTDFNMLFV